MKLAAALLSLILAAGSVAAYDQDDYRGTRQFQPQGFSADSANNRNISFMNARLSFLQTPKVAPPPAQRFDIKTAPLVQTAQARKPDTFLAFLGRSIKQNVVEVGKAIAAAVVRPFQAIKQMVTNIVRTFAPMVSPRVVAPPTTKPGVIITTPAPPTGPPTGFTPTPQEKPKPITTPIQTQKPTILTTPIADTRPKHNITTPAPQMPRHNITVPAPPSPTVVMKGPAAPTGPGILGGLINRGREALGLPIKVPIGQLYPEPGNDFDRRGGKNDPFTVEQKVKDMRGGKREDIYGYRTPTGFAVTNGQNTLEAAQKLRRESVYIHVIRGPNENR